MSNGELPAGWTVTTIGEITHGQVDQSGPRGNSAEFTYIDIGSIDRSNKRIVDPKSIPTSNAPSRAKQRVQEDDVLVSMTRPNLNAVAIVPTELGDAIASTGFDVLRSSQIQPKWLFYLVQTDVFVSSMSMLVQGALYPAVRPRDIRAYEVALPPRAEQDRIIAEIEALLTDMEAAVASLKRVQANLTRYRASVLKAACEGRLVPTEAELACKEGRTYETGEQLLARILKERRAKWEADQLAKMLAAGKPPSNDDSKKKYKEPAPPDTSNLPELPEGWAWASIDQLAWYVRNGLSTKPDAQSGAAILRISAVRPLKVDVSDIRFLGICDDLDQYSLVAGDLLFTRYNGTRELVGVCGVVPQAGTGLHHPDKLIRVRLIGVCPDYIGIAANMGASRRYLEQKIRTTAGQSGVSGEDIRGTPVPLPPFEEQSRLAAEVERRLSLLDVIGNSSEVDLARADRLRQAILKRAFEGKLVPQDPNDEPASVLLERIRAERAAKTSTAASSGDKRRVTIRTSKKEATC